MAYPPISTLPAAPSRQDPSNFADEADAFLGALPTFGTETNTAGSYIDGKAAEVETDATNASAASDAAIAASGATAWVSGASYSAGDVVWSLIDYQTYRAQTTHTGETTDPSADSTNWVVISFAAAATSGLSFTASGAITAGNNVGINSDGTVSTFSSGFFPSLVATTTLDAQNIAGPFAYAGSDTYVFTYEDDSVATAGIYVVAGTRGTDNAFTMGTPVFVGNKNTTDRNFDIAYATTSAKFIIAFGDQDNSGRISYLTGTLAGTAITLSAISQASTIVPTYVGVATDDNETAFITYGNGANVYAIAYNFATDNDGAQVTINSDNAINVRAMWNPDASVFLALSVVADDLTVELARVAGTTISQGSGSDSINAVISTSTDLYVSQNAETNVVRFISKNTDGDLVQFKLTLSEFTTPVFDTAVVTDFSSDLVNAYYDISDVKWYFVSGTVFGSVAADSATTSILSYDNKGIALTMSASARGSTSYYDSANSLGVVVGLYAPDDNPYAAVLAPSQFGPDLTKFIGLAATDAVDTAQVTVNVIGEVNSNQTGLTAGGIVYSSIDNSVTTGSGDAAIGRALSSTSVLIQTDPTL